MRIVTLNVNGELTQQATPLGNKVRASDEEIAEARSLLPQLFGESITVRHAVWLDRERIVDVEGASASAGAESKAKARAYEEIERVMTVLSEGISLALA